MCLRKRDEPAEEMGRSGVAGAHDATPHVRMQPSQSPLDEERTASQKNLPHGGGEQRREGSAKDTLAWLGMPLLSAKPLRPARPVHSKGHCHAPSGGPVPAGSTGPMQPSVTYANCRNDHFSWFGLGFGFRGNSGHVTPFFCNCTRASKFTKKLKKIRGGESFRLY